MNKILIYHNPRWSKSRESIKILNNLDLDYEIIEYMNIPLTINDLKLLGEKMGVSAKHFIRTKDPLFNKLDLISFIDNENILFQYMSENPRLIERPIIVKGNKAILGRPIESIKKFLIA